MQKLISAMLLVLLTVTTAWAQPLVERVPGDAVVYVGWRGADDPDLGYAGSNLEAITASTDLPGALNRTLMVIQQANPGNPWVGLVTGLVDSISSASWHHPTAAYVQASGEPQMPVRLTVMWEVEGEAAQKLLMSLEDLVAQVPPDAPLMVGQEDGLVSLTIGPAPGSNTAPEGEAAEMEAGLLGQAEGFKRAMKQVDAEGLMVVYVDAQGLLNLIDDFAATESPREQQQWMTLRAALGLEGLNGLAVSAGFDGKDWRCDSFIDAPSPRTGLLALLDGEPITDAELRVVPAEATCVTVFRLDLGMLLDEVRRVAGEIDPEALEELNQALMQADEMTGVNIEGDLIRALGSGWVLYTDPGATGSGIMGLTLVNQLKDADAAERSLTSLQALANAMMGQAGGRSGIRVRFHTVEENGMTMYTLGIPFVAPTWSVHDGKLYAGLYQQTVSQAGTRATAGGKSILDNKGFRRVMDRLDAGSRPNKIVFTDLPRTAEDSYANMVMITQMGTGFLSMFGGQHVPPMLPPYAQIEPVLSPSGEVAWADAAGYHGRMISPFPGSAFLGPQGSMNSMSTAPVLVGTMLPALGAARRSARQMKSTTQCRGIVQTQVMYGSSHKDVMANDIAELAQGNYFSVEYVISPSVGISIPWDYKQWDEQKQNEWVRQNASYVLIPDLKVDIDRNTVCVFERPDHSGGGGIAVGFNDGSAQFMDEWEARQMIEAQTGKTLEELVQRQQNYKPASE